MAQSLAKILLHIVFSTKNRIAYLSPAIRAELYPYAATVLKSLDCPPIQIGGIEDHIHILCSLSRTMSVADLLEEIKKPTSKWLKTKGTDLASFHWQNGYGAFSVSPTNAKNVVGYIANQGKHHRRLTFQDEFRGLLKKSGIPFDERYVWD